MFKESKWRMIVPVSSLRLRFKCWMMLNEAVLRVHTDSAAVRSLVNCEVGQRSCRREIQRGIL